jgi:DNA-directed RNA polymerase subunit RPC12/RpoP
MSATITVICPECNNEIKAPADFAGKKVRCKSCGHIFRASPSAPHGAVARAPAGKSVGAPAPPVAPLVADDDDADANPYGVTDASQGFRCPECANEMESPDAVVCLHCGYNTMTRERHSLKKVHETTGGDRFLWLLPGLACAGVVVFLVVFDLLYCLLVRSNQQSGVLLSFFASGAVKMWMCIASLFAIFFCIRFAISRLIYHPDPPEIEKH